MGAQPGDHDLVEGVVGLAVAAGVEAVGVTFPEDAESGAVARRCAQAASERSRSGWSPAATSSMAAVSGADAVEREQARGAGSHQGNDELIEALELAVQEPGAPAQLTQCDPGGITDHGAGTGPQRGQLGDQVNGGMPGEPGPQAVGAGHDQRPGLVDGLGPLRARAALGDHQRPDRLHRTVAALRRTGRPAGLGRSTSSWNAAASPARPAGPDRRRRCPHR